MPVTRKGDHTVQGVEYGLAKLCPLCQDEDDPVRWEDRTLVNWSGALRWAHPGCVAGVMVCHPHPNRKRVPRKPE